MRVPIPMKSARIQTKRLYYYHYAYNIIILCNCLRPVYEMSRVIFMVGWSNLYPGIGNVWEYFIDRQLCGTYVLHIPDYSCCLLQYNVPHELKMSL